MPDTETGRPPVDLVRIVDVPGSERWPYLTPRNVRTLRTERQVRMWHIGRNCYLSAAELDAWLATRMRPARTPAA